jgi:2,3-dihydroxyphenylpropionate 1,2-dioxygenase
MNAYLHCLSHTPLVGYVDPEQAVLDEVNGTIADARARIAAFDPGWWCCLPPITTTAFSTM